MPLTDCAAYLRVYEPLAAFEGEERRFWEAYVREGRAPGRREGALREREAAVRALVGSPPRALPDLPPEAFVTEVDGIALVCPWDVRLRSLEALEQFRGELPDEVRVAFVPHRVIDQAATDLRRARADRPDQRPHVLCSTWEVPARWFVLVDTAERELTGPPGSGWAARAPGRELVYRTPMARARRRVARALAVLRRTLEDGDVAVGISELGRWLEAFHPRSVVELDYGGLAELLDDAELATDESARDVAAALAALDEGEPARAAAAYGRVIARGKALQAVERAN